MKKTFAAIACTTLISLSMCIPAFAGQWLSDANGWWWRNDDGSYPTNSWQWIDGNNDGVAESYYFNEQGYCLMNTTTPDGYTVNPAGAWQVNGVVQTQPVAASNPAPAPEVPAVAKAKLLDLAPVSKFCFNSFNNYRTNKNELWSEGFYLESCFEDTYVEYYLGRQYNTLTFTYAPKEGAYSDLQSTVEVYGDNDTLLWSSDTIQYKSDSKEAVVDISGQEYVKINLHNNYRFIFTGSTVQVLFKNGTLY